MNDDIVFENNGKKKKSNIIIIIIPIIIILIVAGYFIIKYRNSYDYYEKKMVNSAISYIDNNNISIKNDTYLSIKDLGITKKDNCSELSGVIIDNNYNYQAYLKCDDYETNIVDNSSNVSLKGDSLMIIPKGINYYEYGIYGTDDYKIIGNVGTEEGVYTLNYVVGNEMLERKVIIYDDDELKNKYPIITLNGSDVIYLQKYEEFNDPKVNAYDISDSAISSKVMIEGNVNTNEVGEYEVIYSVTNLEGYTNSIRRKVIVAKDYTTTLVTSSIDPSNMTNENVNISLYIEGLDYKETLLPDGTINSNKEIIYSVSSNGDYSFKIFDTDDTFIEEVVNVNNINKEKPTGTCQATLYRDKTEIYVNANASVGISSYNYKVDGMESGFISNNTYTSPLIGKKNVSVTIKDNTNNTSEIVCSVLNKSYREIYIDSNGKQCLSGYTCFIQSNYPDDVQYCSSDTCGSIAKRGCGVISTTTVFSRFVKSPDGDPYDPYEMVDIIKKATNGCKSCGFSAFNHAADRLGIPHVEKALSIKEHYKELLEYLRNDYPAVIRVGNGSAYTDGGHFMMLLGMNEKGEIFLADTHGPSTTATMNSKFKINSWITIDELLEGIKVSDGGADFLIFGTNK